ncbi:hypothetical protein [Helicobacter monodelphidis]|uniref:hypothetical protein n=1 Tax=Helicobacter sp. 15-1451 TaxID=2004995 RepID=UPI0015EC0846|nr:hypothetical protein [Helicobacter sp. 15-1451]
MPVEEILVFGVAAIFIAAVFFRQYKNKQCGGCGSGSGSKKCCDMDCRCASKKEKE